MKTLTIILTMVLLSATSCKKRELSGEAHTLIGTWQWVGTGGEFTDLDPDNTGTSKTLEFTENGKYALIIDSKKKESGHITVGEPDPSIPQNHVMLKFVRNDRFSKKQEFPGNCIIWFGGRDTITIRGNRETSHQDYHMYVRR